VIEAQGYRSGSLFFRRCDRAGCFVEMAISPELIAGLKAAADPQGHIDVVADGGKPVSLPISLKGFGSAHDAMVGLAKQKAQNGAPPAAPDQPAPAPQP
jgi:invasion protein IalB